MDGNKTAAAPDNCQLSIVNYQFILKQYWGYDDFRGIQREIIESIGNGHDTLGLMPTGGGKSLTFQVPALAMDGVCIVITPLIALMKDQVQHLRQRRIKAAAIYSGLSHNDILTILENCVFGAVKLLYVSPERLSSELFRAKVRHMKVSFITVDEAHCISQWGYDFRPSYLRIADIRRDLPGVPVLALTATATPLVVKDIQDKLKTSANPFQVFSMSFERQNLAYMVRHATDKHQQLVSILQQVAGSAIVYTRSRRATKEVAEELNKAGLQATFFHAGLDQDTKDQRQKDWQADRTRIIVATNAFGMGIDKPDVRLVVHIDCPDSIEAYFQEAGRAGRDGKKAYAVLLYNGSDHRKLEKRISDNFPEKDYIKEVYEHLAFYYQIATGSGYNSMFAFDIDDFCRRFHHFPIQVDAALKILHRAGYLEYTEEQENQARVKFVLERDDLYRLRQTDNNEEKVITTMLRNYGGLFVDYVYIDESTIARQTGLTIQEVYLVLKGLSMKRILNFIPQKKTPYIRYTQRREDKEHIQLLPEVYEERKEQFIGRIKAMEDYAADDRQCRSRRLLRYFGEVNSHDCGICDVCQAYGHGNDDHDAEDNDDDAVHRILRLLADGRRHHVSELLTLQQPAEQTDSALEHLLREEQIFQEDGFLVSASKKIQP